MISRANTSNSGSRLHNESLKYRPQAPVRRDPRTPDYRKLISAANDEATKRCHVCGKAALYRVYDYGTHGSKPVNLGACAAHRDEVTRKSRLFTKP